MKFTKSVFITVILFFSQFSFAAGTLKEMSNCGSAKIISGDSCSNFKVEFDFKGCAFPSKNQIGNKIICKGSKILSRFYTDKFHFEAEFNKEVDGWGGDAWKSASTIKQWEKVSPIIVSETPMPTRITAVATATESAPATSNIVTAPAALTSNLKFSGFLDFRFSSFSARANPSVVNPHAESGYGLEDGAMYVNYEKDRLSFLIDIPFRRAKDVDINPSATTPQQSSNNNIIVGAERAQAYLKYKLLETVSLAFGQFDTIFGVELNDSKDRVFGKTGIVYDNQIPVTHTGLMLDYAANGMYTKLFAANPNNKGTYGTTASKDENTEYGTAIGYTNETLRGQIGYMSRPLLTAALGSTYDNRALLDITMGATLGSLTVDLEFAQIDDPNKNTLTPNNANDKETNGTGGLLLTTYKLTDIFQVGARIEQIQNDPAASAGIKAASAYGLSLHYKVTPEFVARTEYIDYSYKNITDDKWNDSRFNVAAMVTF